MTFGKVARGGVCATALAALTACGTSFVEPNPPALADGERSVAPAVRTEPVVYGVVLNLHVTDAAACAAIADRALGTVRAAAARAGEATRELPVADLAPGCTRAPDRLVSLDAVDAALRQAEAAFPGRTVRAVLVYVDDIDAPVEPAVASALDGLAARASLRGAPAPYVIALAAQAAAAAYPFGERIPWTFGTDGAMWGALDAALGAVLPLASWPASASARVLEQPLASGARLVKICGRVGKVTVPGCPIDGSAALNLGYSAVATFQVGRAETRRIPPPAPAIVRFEACTARCDRYVDAGGLVRWSSHVGCTGAP